MKVSEPIRVLVVEDHLVARVGVTTIVNAQPDMTVVAEAVDAAEAIALHCQHHPDVTLMDLRLPGPNGVEATATIRRNDPKARIVVLTTYDGDGDIRRALEAGAQGYLTKEVLADELLSAIRTVHRGHRYLPAALTRRLADHVPGNELSSRESEVLRLVVQGMSNKEIAASLHITDHTVKNHIKNILGKLGVGDRTQATTTALRRGLVHLP